VFIERSFETIGFIFGCFIAMGVYYNFVVTPNDELRYQIIDCMSDNTQDEYERCRKEIIKENK